MAGGREPERDLSQGMEEGAVGPLERERDKGQDRGRGRQPGRGGDRLSSHIKCGGRVSNEEARAGLGEEARRLTSRRRRCGEVCHRSGKLSLKRANRREEGAERSRGRGKPWGGSGFGLRSLCFAAWTSAPQGIGRNSTEW